MVIVAEIPVLCPEIAFSPTITNKSYGHGWQLQTDPLKNRIISHRGGAAGFMCNFAMIEEDDACVIILNNKSFQPVKEVKLNPDELKKLLGALSSKELQLMILISS